VSTDANDAWADPDSMIERVRQQVEQAQEAAKRATQMRGQFESIRGKAESDRNEVRVTVDTSGRLLDLQIDDDATGRGGRELAQIILTTIREAQRRAGTEAMALVEDTFGAESGAATHMREELERIAPPAEADHGIRWT
jgi:DNA-binding protein YbaB